MSRGGRSGLRLAAVLVSMAWVPLPTQIALAQVVAEPAQRTRLPSGIERIAGTEPSAQIQYLQLVLTGSLMSSHDSQPDAPPLLVAECTLMPNGKHRFDLFASFAGIHDLRFYPPWKPSGSNLFPPTTRKAIITMEFFGYTRVKPAKKQWEVPTETPDLYRYNPPGFGSTNMEDVSYYLRFLRSLPKLRLTLSGQSAEFVTTPLLDQIRNEPLCAAAGLR